MKWMWTGLLVAAAGVTGAACGAPEEAPPEPIQRSTQSPGTPDPIVATEDPFDPNVLDIPTEEPDGGCCVVRFALERLEDEVQAELVFPSARYAMGTSGGPWVVDACVDLRSNDFHFQAALPTDDGTSVLWVDRTNAALPVSTDSTLAEQVHVFEVPDGGTCDTFDATPYAQVPDAG